MPDQWLEDQNQKINALMDWIEEQQALAGLFPVDPYLVELAEGEMIDHQYDEPYREALPYLYPEEMITNE